MTEALFQPFPMPGGRRAQVWRHQPQYRRPRHFHEEPELNLVVRGSGVIAVGEKALPVSAGTLLLFAPGQDHVLLEASSDFDLFALALKPELASCAAERFSSVTFGLSSSEIEAWTAELTGLGEVHDSTAVEQRLVARFERIVARRSPPHVLSRRALEFVVEEPGLSGAVVAERLGAGPSGVSRRFHQDLGVTFVEYRARLRLMRFVRLVDEGRTLSTAAFEADFGSYAQCHRVFRRLLGCTPRDYFAGARARVNDATFRGDFEGSASR